MADENKELQYDTAGDHFGYIRSHNITEDPGNWMYHLLGSTLTPIGSGENAMSIGQIGMMGYGLLNQNERNKQMLEQARRQYELSKGNMQANFMNQGTAYLNNGLFQLQGMKAFNPNAGAELATNFNAAATQLNNAGSKIGLNNAFADQQNQIQKYNQLANKGV